jgi:hypothetical protein
MFRHSLLRTASSGWILALLLCAGCRSAATPTPSSPNPESLSETADSSEPLKPPATPDAPAPAAVTPPAAAEAPAAPAAPYRNTIRWTTASEVDSFGFDVYRGEAEEGPFVRLNERPIAGAGTSDESHSYAYVDESIDPTKEYFYYVESISITGDREKFTPVNRARAKLPPSTPAAP